MNIKCLKSILNGQSYIITLNGLVNTIILISRMKVIITNDEIIIRDNDNDRLKINKHQIMNIKSNTDGSIDIWLDQLLKIHISSK